MMMILELEKKKMEETRKKQLMMSLMISSIFISIFFPFGNAANFVLIHGSCHGGWSWYKLVALIRSSSSATGGDHHHKVTALDLAASGIDPKQVDDIPSISDYFKPLRDFMVALPLHERVIMVGHSFGGLAISQAMETFPHKISVAVFVAALMPGPTLNISTLNQEVQSFRRQTSLLDSHYTYGNGKNNPPKAFIFGPQYLAADVYQLSPTEDLGLATILMRPLRLYTEEDMSKELRLSSKKYGSVRRVFILSDKDRVGKKDFQRWMIKKNPPDEVKEVACSDHMVMMSKPAELWALLQDIAEKYS
ncbi:methyl jasmonate esterase 1-like [Cornus florida]|uniref:methyl jasmonate esterase 1-like n=1 Tax=Cornus florida TaxID=4283 RepID=UPI002899EDC3|nr:methyl jasmonate esterase 1-like [Cornus florida]